MDIKALLGESYKEGMTVEELTAALEAVEVPEDKQLKDSITRLSRENAEKKRENRTQATAIEELQSQLSALQRENAISKHTASFLDMGYDREAALASATALADGDIPTLMEQQGKFLQGYQAKVKAELMKRTPAPVPDAPGYQPGDMTREAFSRLTLAQKQQFASANPEEYQKLYSPQ